MYPNPDAPESVEKRIVARLSVPVFAVTGTDCAPAIYWGTYTVDAPATFAAVATWGVSFLMVILFVLLPPVLELLDLLEELLLDELLLFELLFALLFALLLALLSIVRLSVCTIVLTLQLIAV